jgi:hypothetical protein
MTAKGPVYLHLGAPKTGTTYLQTVMDAAAAPLQEHGLLFPAGKSGQQRATRDLLGQGSSAARRQRSGSWHEVVTQINEWPGTAVFSNETLAMGLRPRRIGRVVSRFPDRDVHVVYTVRDLVRQLPACWQESLKNRATTPFAEYFATISAAEPLRRSDPGERLWAAQDAAAVLTPWADVVGAHRVHVVTVPPRGAPRDQLLQRFGDVIAMDLSGYGNVATEPNVSLDATEAAVLRQLNAELARWDEAMPWLDYVRLVKRYLANSVFPQRESRIPLWLTSQQAAWAMQRSSSTADAIERAGFDVVGDVGDMRPTSPDVPISEQPLDDPAVADQRDVALLALAHLLRRPASG